MASTQRYEVEAWLGDAADEMTSEQIDEFHRAWDEISGLLPDPDDQDQRDELLTSAHLAITGGLTLEQAAIGKAALRWLTVSAVRDGMSEVEAAERAGVTRMTVRAWQGKR